MERFQTRPVTPTQVQAVQLQGPTSVGKQKGRRGDWLVSKAGGLLEIVGAAEFAATYEPVDSNGSKGGGNGKPSVSRRPRAQGRRQKVAGTKAAPAPKTNGRSGKLSAALPAVQRRYEKGDDVPAIAKEYGVSTAALYARAKKLGWKRPEKEKQSRPNPGAAASATTAPRFDEPKQLSGKVRCTECESWTSTDPCEFCGKKQRKNWG